MSRRLYYTLVTSLPRLVHFTRAERLAINRERLGQRLSGLSAEHAAELALAEDLVEWRRQPLGRTDEEIVERHRQVMAGLTFAPLAQFVAWRIDQRTLLAGLRRRHGGASAPRADEAWGVGPRAGWMRSHWDTPDFGLAHHYPWVTEAHGLLSRGDALGLERLLMDVVWERLGRIAETRPFGFEEVFAFVFKWDIASRWLAYTAEGAVGRFNELVTEGMREHQRLFG